MPRKLHIHHGNIETERIQLVPIIQDHLDDLFQIYYDYDVIRFTDSNLHFTKQDTFHFIENIQTLFNTQETIYWGIQLKNTGKIIGTIAFYHIDHKHYFASIGCLLSPHFWRQGYMSEVLKQIIPFAFNEMLLHRIEAQMYIHHDASVSLFEKHRFTREAMLRENFQIEWKHENSYMYSIIKSDFAKLSDFYKS